MFLECVAPFYQLLHGFQLKIVDPGLISYDSLWQKALTSSITFVETSGDCFTCHCVWTCQHSWHPRITDLGTAKLFNNCYYTVSTNRQGRVCYMMVITCQFINQVAIVRYYCSARVTIL
jgi:hypothetical protein